MGGQRDFVHAMPMTANLMFSLMAGGAAASGLFVVPGLLALGYSGSLCLLIPCVLATVPHWALIHEAIHGHLHSRRSINEGVGRALAILFLAPFDGLRFGHLSHHALNARPSERPELFDPRQHSRVRAAAVYYSRLLCGLHLVEVASGPLSLLPRRLLRPVVRRLFYDGAADAGHMADRAERVLLAPTTLRQLRVDALAVIVLLLFSVLTYGGAWPLLLLALLGRAFLVSLMDNAPHYGGELADPDQGFDMRLPGRLGALVLNTNLHGTHHRHPNLPWTALPRAFRKDGGTYAGSYLVVPWRQLRGPVPLHPGPAGPNIS